MMNAPRKGILEQAFSILITGLDYRAYRDNYLARMDEQLVRQRAAQFIVETRDRINALLHTWTTQHLPPATREAPYPGSAVLKDLRTLRSAIDQLEQVHVKLLTLPVPADDLIWEKYRNQETVFAALRTSDADLLLAAAALREESYGLDAQALLSEGNDAALYHGKLATMNRVISQRADVFALPLP